MCQSLILGADMAQTSEHIFVSYAREDVAFVQKLAAGLERTGLAVWWDFRLLAGAKFRTEIATRIDSARKVIVVWSPNSVSSPFVLDEAARALEQEKLVPLSISGAAPPFGFGQLHTLRVDSVDGCLDRIVAVLHESPVAQPTVRRWRLKVWSLRLGLIALLMLAVAAGVILTIDGRDVDRAINCYKFGCELNYVTYRSQSMRVEFVYPMKYLTLDTMKEHQQRLPMFNPKGEIEVEIFRSPIPGHRDPIHGSADEQKKLTESGYTINYVAPQVNPSEKNWYVISGMLPDGRHYYIRRWYTAGDVASIEFHYRHEFKALYDKIIADMTLRGIRILDPI